MSVIGTYAYKKYVRMCAGSIVSDSLPPQGLLQEPLSHLPGSSVHGISQTRILEWVAISSSRDAIFISCVSCFDRQILYH